MSGTGTVKLRLDFNIFNFHSSDSSDSQVKSHCEPGRHKVAKWKVPIYHLFPIFNMT